MTMPFLPLGEAHFHQVPFRLSALFSRILFFYSGKTAFHAAKKTGILVRQSPIGLNRTPGALVGNSVVAFSDVPGIFLPRCCIPGTLGSRFQGVSAFIFPFVFRLSRCYRGAVIYGFAPSAEILLRDSGSPAESQCCVVVWRRKIGVFAPWKCPDACLDSMLPRMSTPYQDFPDV